MIVTNSVLLSVILMLILCIRHVNVVIALTASSIVCGLLDGMSLRDTVVIFSNGLGGGAKIALSYAILGAFASAIAHSGLPDLLAKELVNKIKLNSKHSIMFMKFIFFIAIGLMSVACKNIIPVHIAFIPILISPLLKIFNNIGIDRRILACIITCGLIVSYMIIPIGFGEIFLDNILRNYLLINGLNVSLEDVVFILKIPAIVMLSGCILAIVKYRKRREYKISDTLTNVYNLERISSKTVWISILAILIAFIVQIFTREIILGALSGFFVFSCLGIVERNDSDRVVIEGFKMMAGISFTMIAAAGFGCILRASSDMAILINWVAECVGNSRLLAAIGMLLVGFLISVGIGSSFSTVPIVAPIYVPLCLKLGFSPIATVIVVAISGVCGDAGSPASDSTLGPTMGLNADGQHNHIKDTVFPAFLYIVIPVFFCGIICASIF